MAQGGELLASGSDDFTVGLWDPAKSKTFIQRMTGHQKSVNFVSFSPDGRLLASASFDKSCKVWDGQTGKFQGTCRGHVGSVYRVTWAPDSRLLVTASEDSTMKLWNMKVCGMMCIYVRGLGFQQLP